jgi:hypothetical protein
VIDQAAYRQAVEMRLDGYRAFQRELDKEERRTSGQVGSWVRDTVKDRRRAAMPHRCRRAFPQPAVKPAEDMRDRSSGGGPKQRFA